MFRKWAALAAAVAAFASPGAAQAKWYRAETDRFIVYGEGREAKIREMAVRLTAFDAVLRLHNPPPEGRSPRKLEVYMVGGPQELRKIAPRSRRLGGFYTARPTGTFAAAIVRNDASRGDDILFHEYAHHFMLANFPAAYPGWFVEGWAEYFSTLRFEGDRVVIGEFDPNRVYGLFNIDWLPMDELIAKAPSQVPFDRRSAYYSQSWLLMHYLRTDPTRAAQLTRATAAIAAGTEPWPAMQSALGMDAKALAAALRDYRTVPRYSIPNPAPAPQVALTALPDSAGDLLLDGVRLVATPAGSSDDLFLGDVRRRAARWPGDRLAELTLARAEFTIGDVAVGEAIIARRLAADPNDAEALLLAGTGQVFAAQRDATGREARMKAARPYLIKAYQADKGDYRTLLMYAISRMGDPAWPNDNDVNALLEAQKLGPGVAYASYTAGAVLIGRGRKAEADRILAVVANAPHGGPMAAKARALMAGRTTAEAEAAGAKEGEEEETPPPIPPEGDKKTPAS